MREIKFRAWDKMEKKMFYKTRLRHFNDLFVGLSGEVIESIGCLKGWENKIIIVGDSIVNQRELDMQFMDLIHLFREWK